MEHVFIDEMILVADFCLKIIHRRIRITDGNCIRFCKETARRSGVQKISGCSKEEVFGDHRLSIAGHKACLKNLSKVKRNTNLDVEVSQIRKKLITIKHLLNLKKRFCSVDKLVGLHFMDGGSILVLEIQKL